MSMSKDKAARKHASIDPALIASISREVIARLRSASPSATDASICDQLITSETIESITGKPARILIAKSAVVTPAACDEARRRGITIHRTNGPQPSTPTHHASIEITDTSDPQRAQNVREQLERRSVCRSAARIVLSDQPANEVHRLCAIGERAVMIISIIDVPRFADDFKPTVWVLDMKRMNLAVAVNAAARITQQENRIR